MPTTVPDGIFYADGSTPLSVEAISAAEATSIQAALTNNRAIRSFKWVDQDAQDDQIDMQAGDEGYRIDTSANYRYNGTDWKRSEGGLVLIKPTTVSGTGVSVSSSGRVNFTGASAISVDGCFTTEFDDYRIVLDIPTVSALESIVILLRSGGGNNASTLYDAQRVISSGTSITTSAVTAASWGPVIGNRLRHYVTGDIFSPMLAQYTAAQLKGTSSDAGTNLGIMEIAAWYRGTTQFDGIHVARVGANTLTGSLKIYGYNQ